MKSFNVLDRNQDMHRHYLLEASAGTGKTFSIQNIVVRLLIESGPFLEPLSLEKILIVTFTKAAARDVRGRIRLGLEQAVGFLHAPQGEKENVGGAADYLLAYMEMGADAVEKARRRLQKALLTFDRAQIFTIHSFCARMMRRFAMEGDLGMNSSVEDEPLSLGEIMSVIRDFFRTEMRPADFSPGQLAILLEGDPGQKKLLRLMQTHYEYPLYPSFAEVLDLFNEEMRSLKTKHSLTPEKLIADFEAQIGSYSSYKAGETKKETLAKAISFARLFEKESNWTAHDLDALIADGAVFVKALDPKLIKTKNLDKSKLHYPHIREEFAKNLSSLIEEAGDFPRLLARLARNCKVHVQRYQIEEEKFGPGDILLKMNEALENPLFISSVQNAYQAAIIDEFQDTDPLQWKMFRSLFIGNEQAWKGFIYLVGDPKQSIYSFRQADIYTYLHAVRTLGEECCFSLNVNYRSHIYLVEALNQLFSQKHTPGLFPLPQGATFLECPPVQAVVDNDYFINEPRGAIHFILALGKEESQGKSAELEESVWFPFIAGEIFRLQKEKKIPLSQFAVLVRDRFQALRMAGYFTRVGIAYLNQRGTSLVQSEALPAFIELLHAVLHPQDLGALRTLLGNPLIGWTHEEIKANSSPESLLSLMHDLRRSLFGVGFASFFQEVLQANFKKGGVLTNLLKQEGGIEFFRDIEQIAALIIDHEHIEWNGPEGIIPFLDRLSIWEENGDERVLRFQDPAREGVRLLTLHSSKGLEFGVVFALGLVIRTPVKEEFIPVSLRETITLVPFSKDTPLYQSYCEECDAEKMRQLYVALTRAKSQLYLPVALGTSSEKLQRGEASPMDLFLARLYYPQYSTYDEIYERIRANTGKHLLDFLEKVGKESHITWSIHQEVIPNFASPPQTNISSPLIPPQEIILAPSFFHIDSFSSLKKEHIKASPGTPPSDYFSLTKTKHTIPANAETGLCLHNILEKIPFSSMRDLQNEEEAISIIRPFIQKGLYSNWESVIASLVFSTLTVSLPVQDGEVRLCDLKPAQIYREMPFMFSSSNQGVMKGVFDLLFYTQGLYYLVDWKTNWLGETSDCYTPSLLANAMEENSYHLQASIYEEAISRYLSLVDDRPFTECFGGTFYLFLRGLEQNKETGIFGRFAFKH